MAKFFTLLALTITVIGYGQSKKTFQLEKIIFHTSMCYGYCPSYHLQVDKDKKINLFAEQVYKNVRYQSYEPDTTKTGYFTGIVADTTFNKLTNELQKIGLDSLEFDGATCCDGSIKTIIVYYNGKRKYLKSMFPPVKAGKLISILYEICETSKLQRTDERFKIEDGITIR